MPKNNKNKPEVMKEPPNIVLDKKKTDKLKGREIIVNKVSWETEVAENGDIIKKRKIKKVNITKKINEEKKLIKNNQAEEKLAELEKIFNEK